MIKRVLCVILLITISRCFGYETDVIIKTTEKTDCGSYNLTLISSDLFNVTLYKHKNASYQNGVQEFKTIKSFTNVRYFYQELSIEEDDSYVYGVNIQQLSNASYVDFYKNIKECDEQGKSNGRLLSWPGILIFACICAGSGGLCACCKREKNDSR